ncbi:MAG: hypothetical protein PHC39_04885 [Proteiniphilum sp.]|nr:hypothetical protein [Proteiniphilum sp.]
MTEQTDIIENQENSAAIPIRPLRPQELVELKIMARVTKEQASALMGFLRTHNREFEAREDTLDDVGFLCDEIIEWCSDELKKDERRKRR